MNDFEGLSKEIQKDCDIAKRYLDDIPAKYLRVFGCEPLWVVGDIKDIAELFIRSYLKKMLDGVDVGIEITADIQNGSTVWAEFSFEHTFMTEQRDADDFDLGSSYISDEFSADICEDKMLYEACRDAADEIFCHILMLCEKEQEKWNDGN